MSIDEEEKDPQEAEFAPISDDFIDDVVELDDILGGDEIPDNDDEDEEDDKVDFEAM